MKWIFALMTCFAICILNVSGLCDLGPAANYIPEKLSRTWYIRFASPEVIAKFQNGSKVLKLEGNTYYDTTTTTVVGSGQGPQVFKGTWVINDNNTLTVEFPALPNLNSLYRIQSTDKNSKRYFVIKGCPPSFGDEGFTLVLFWTLCPQECYIKRAKKDIEKLGLDFDSYAEDPVVKEICSK